jgi:hypothetical protein
MAQDIVSGMFGLSPYEAQQQQQAALDQQAMQFANMDPRKIPAYLAGRVGQGLGGMLAESQGMVLPQVAEAENRQAAFKGADLQTPQGLRTAAERFMQMGDQKRAYLLAQQAKAMEEGSRKAALDEFKTRDEALFRRDERAQQRLDKIEAAKDALAQKAEAAKLRSEDMRLSIEQRSEAAKEATAARREIAAIQAESRMALQQFKGLQGNVEKPMTAEQDRKLRVLMGKDRQMVGQVESDAAFLDKAIERLETHPGLSKMTGWQAYLPSAPETSVTTGEAKAAETILNEIKGKTATLGRSIASQSGKLGNMAVQEWKIVSDSLAALDPKSKEFKNQLQNLRAQLRGLESRVKEGYSTTYDPYLEKMPEFGIGTIPKPKVTKEQQPENDPLGLRKK